MQNLTTAEQKRLKELLTVDRFSLMKLRDVHPYAEQLLDLDARLIEKLEALEPPKPKTLIEKLDEKLEAGRPTPSYLNLNTWQIEVLKMALLKLRYSLEPSAEDSLEIVSILGAIDDLERMALNNQAQIEAAKSCRIDGLKLDKRRGQWKKK